MDSLANVAGAQWLLETRIVTIVRGVSQSAAVPLANALYEGGIRVMEITLNTPDAPTMIDELLQQFGEKMWIGAGTVLDINGARLAKDAGARFFVTPNTDEQVIQFGVQNGIPVFSGAFTPTEVVRAFQAGATMVKIFPCSSVGPKYLKELQGPLSHIPIMAVGGVSADNAADYIRAGAKAVGVGGNLVDKTAIHENKFDKIKQSAEALVRVVNGAM